MEIEKLNKISDLILKLRRNEDDLRALKALRNLNDKLQGNGKYEIRMSVNDTSVFFEGSLAYLVFSQTADDIVYFTERIEDDKKDLFSELKKLEL